MAFITDQQLALMINHLHEIPQFQTAENDFVDLLKSPEPFKTLLEAIRDLYDLNKHKPYEPYNKGTVSRGNTEGEKAFFGACLRDFCEFVYDNHRDSASTESLKDDTEKFINEFEQARSSEDKCRAAVKVAACRFLISLNTMNDDVKRKIKKELAQDPNQLAEAHKQMAALGTIDSMDKHYRQVYLTQTIQRLTREQGPVAPSVGAVPPPPPPPAMAHSLAAMVAATPLPQAPMMPPPPRAAGSAAPAAPSRNALLDEIRNSNDRKLRNAAERQLAEEAPKPKKAAAVKEENPLMAELAKKILQRRGAMGDSTNKKEDDSDSDWEEAEETSAREATLKASTQPQQQTRQQAAAPTPVLRASSASVAKNTPVVEESEAAKGMRLMREKQEAARASEAAGGGTQPQQPTQQATAPTPATVVLKPTAVTPAAVYSHPQKASAHVAPTAQPVQRTPRAPAAARPPVSDRDILNAMSREEYQGLLDVAMEKLPAVRKRAIGNLDDDGLKKFNDELVVQQWRSQPQQPMQQAAAAGGAQPNNEQAQARADAERRHAADQAQARADAERRHAADQAQAHANAERRHAAEQAQAHANAERPHHVGARGAAPAQTHAGGIHVHGHVPHHVPDAAHGGHSPVNTRTTPEPEEIMPWERILQETADEAIARRLQEEEQEERAAAETARQDEKTATENGQEAFAEQLGITLDKYREHLGHAMNASVAIDFSQIESLQDKLAFMNNLVTEEVFKTPDAPHAGAHHGQAPVPMLHGHALHAEQQGQAAAPAAAPVVVDPGVAERQRQAEDAARIAEAARLAKMLKKR